MADSGSSGSLRTLVLKGDQLHAKGLVGPILDLDRENMESVVAESGQEFPLEKVLEGLCDPLTSIVLLLDGRELAGYVEFCPDSEVAQDVYVCSIQLRRANRHSLAFARLVSETAATLEQQSFRSLRTSVHRTNKGALDLFLKLGFRAVEMAEEGPMLRLVADRSILISPLVRRLSASVARS